MQLSLNSEEKSTLKILNYGNLFYHGGGGGVRFFYTARVSEATDAIIVKALSLSKFPRI